MKIAIFTDTLYPEINGVANTLSLFAEYLRSRHIEHMFFAPDYDRVEQEAFQSPVVRYKGWAPPLYPECRLAFPLYSFEKSKIEAFKPDVIHVTDQLGIGYMGLKYAREHNIPLVMSYHTNFDQYLKYYKLEFLDSFLWGITRKIYNQADMTLAPSKHTKNQLIFRGFKNVGIWSRGINTEDFNPAKRDIKTRKKLRGKTIPGVRKFLFLYVGRLAAEKNLDVLQKAIEIVQSKTGNCCRFVFTGEGPYGEVLKKSQCDAMVFTGVKKGVDLQRIYASCDAFVFPSGTETFGNVLLEAMASGLPSVCVNSGGVTDFAQNGENALVAQANNAKSFAKAMLLLVKKKGLRKKLREGALQTAQKRSWVSIFERLLADYTQAIEAKADKKEAVHTA